MVQFVIDVVLDPSKAVSGNKKVRRELKKTEVAADRLGKAFRRAFGAAALIAGVTAATRTLASFSQEMSTVKAITQATAAEFDRLRESAKDLGSTTRFTATQAAEGMSFLARAGFEAGEVLDTIGDTLNLAQAGALGLGQAADITSNALTAFRLETDQAGRVVDVLALAANSANTTVAQLGDALKLVAPIAAGVGVEIEEVTAHISALSNAGLQATLAGTGLRRIISELESPSSKTAATLSRLNLETEDYKVSAVGLTVALKRLAQAGVDTGLGLEIFGDRGGPAFEVLSKSIVDVEAFTIALNAADGTAQRIATTMDDNLNGSILAMKSALEGVVLAAGDAGATGVLRGFFDVTTVGLRTLSENIQAVTTTAVVLGTTFAAIRLAPFGEAALASAKAFTVLNIALARGTAQSITGAIAARTRAQVEVDAARTSLASTRVTQGAALAEQHRTTALVLGTQATFAAKAAETQLAALRVKSVVQTEALAAANTRLAVATTAATLKARALALVSPFGLVVAGAAAAGFAINAYLNNLNKVRDATLRVTEEGKKLGLVGFERIAVDVERVTAEIERLNKQADKDFDAFGVVSPNLITLLENAEDRLFRFTSAQRLLENGTAASVEVANEQVAALRKLNNAITDVVVGFEKENTLLALNSREREVQISLIEEISALEKAGGKLTDTDRQELEGLIRRNQELREQAEAFESVRGPQAAYDTRLAALNALQIEGRISAQELKLAIVALGQAAGKVDIDIGGGRGAGDLDEETEKIRRNAVAQRERAVILRELDGGLASLNARQVQVLTLEQEGVISGEQATAAFASISEELRRLNPEYARLQDLMVEINGPTEQLVQRQADLENLIASGADSLGRYADELERVNEKLNPLNEAQQLQADILRDIKGPGEELIRVQEALGVLLDQNKISADEYALAMQRASGATAEFRTTSDGLRVGLEEGLARITDVASAAADVVAGAFAAVEDAATDSLTGAFSFLAKKLDDSSTSWVDYRDEIKASFKSAIDSVISDISRLLIRQAALAAFGEGGGGLLTSLFGGERAGGGDVNPGQAFLVGEEGPELFSPPEAGNIVPAGETAARMNAGAAPAPVVNIAPPVTNIRNVVEGEDDAEREDEILNVIRRNRRSVKGTLA